MRKNVSSGGPWEDVVGYSRAVRVGPHVWVAGTTAMTPDGMADVGDPYAQAKRALAAIEKALAEAGASMSDVVRTRMYVTDIRFQDAVGRAHAEAFGNVKPAATMVQVANLADPAMLVEIEAEAYAPSEK